MLKKNKVESIQGYGRLAGQGRVKRHRRQGPEGAKSRPGKMHPGHGLGGQNLPGFEPDGKTILTNKEVLALKAIPGLDGDHGGGGSGRGIRFHLPAIWDESDDSGDAAARRAARGRGDFRRT